MSIAIGSSSQFRMHDSIFALAHVVLVLRGRQLDSFGMYSIFPEVRGVLKLGFHLFCYVDPCLRCLISFLNAPLSDEPDE